MENAEKFPQLRFSEITPENALVLAQLRLEINNDKTPDELKAEADTYATDPNRKALISMEGETPTGFVEMMAESDDVHQDAPEISVQDFAHIVRIAVAEEHRKKGIGTALLHQADQWAIEQGKKGIWLDYLAANDKARTLYEKSGYKDAAEFVDTKKKQKLRRIAIKLFE